MKQALFSLQGRMARLPFFRYSAILLAFLLISWCLLFGIAATDSEFLAFLGIVGMAVGGVGVGVAKLALMVKRLHDIGLSGWNVCWICLIDIIQFPAYGTTAGVILSVVSCLIGFGLLCWPGEAKDNAYGPIPSSRHET